MNKLSLLSALVFVAAAAMPASAAAYLHAKPAPRPAAVKQVVVKKAPQVNKAPAGSKHVQVVKKNQVVKKVVVSKPAPARGPVRPPVVLVRR